MMKTEDVAKLKTVDRFLYWIRERHKIHLRREAGKPKPWTDDHVLQTVFFTNPYRENDKTTVWFKEHVRNPLCDDPDVLMATVIFRWFNRIETGRILSYEGLLYDWRPQRAIEVLEKMRKSGPVFTGAYMIKAGNGPPGCKVRNVCSAITTVWDHRQYLLKGAQESESLEWLWKELTQFPHLGGFMAAQIVADLKYTCVLENARDWWTWCHLGPGGKRGLNRILGKPLKAPPPKDWRGRINDLRSLVNRRLVTGRPMHRMHAQDIQHSLCEFDKYERARLGDGKLKRKYKGQRGAI